MGFGFFLFLAYILAPLTLALLAIWLITRKIIFGKIIGGLFVFVLLIIIYGSIFNTNTKNIMLVKKDYYGQYIIDRKFFPGKQSDWQFNHFRFEIKENDSIYFYITIYDKIINTYRGTISTVKPNNSERLVIRMEQPSSHVLQSNPTVYRSKTGFYLVFNSPKYKNMYFKKGKWLSI